MTRKLLILAAFHRFVPTKDGEPEGKQKFTPGETVAVSDEDADDWIAKGYAKAVDDGPSAD